MCGVGALEDFASVTSPHFRLYVLLFNNTSAFLYRLDACLELLIRTGRLPEAAFLARTYLPSQVSRCGLSLRRYVLTKTRARVLHLFGSLISLIRVVKLWRENLSKVNQKAAESLADPTEYENLFPGLKEAFVVEEWVKETHVDLWPAKQYPLVTVSGRLPGFV